MHSRHLVSCLIVLVCLTNSFSQTDTATFSGRVTDQQGAVVPGAQLVMTNVDTNLSVRQTSNKDGLYVLSGLKPGRYRITVTTGGFRTINMTDIVLNVQDTISQNFKLEIGSVSESVTVVAESTNVNATDATVSTVIDRNFAENLPMNGRSFQSLIELTPGVVLSVQGHNDTGQFSVNGQRASSNYWMVDGVSANIGTSAQGISQAGDALGGTVGSFSALGGTNSLVSIDAMQEFRIQTSTYAPEFGRTPGAQISIATRSGTNRWHGTAFDYLRNDKLDANNWFANRANLPRPQERQNDFGGTLNGPILRDKTFFFFSYEGLRLRLPQVAQALVPDSSSTPGGINVRQSAIAAMQPFLNAFPLPTPGSPEVLDAKGNPTGTARFNASYSNPAALDAYSLRVDHKLKDTLTFFGRYNYSPSSLSQRGANLGTLSSVSFSQITTQTATVGASWSISPSIFNDLRFNYSHVHSRTTADLDGFGGAIPLASLPFPSPFTTNNAGFFPLWFSLAPFYGPAEGLFGSNFQRQINIVDSLSVQKGSHSLKFGVDFRRLSPTFGPPEYTQEPSFLNVLSSAQGNTLNTLLTSSVKPSVLFQDLGIFAQDTWRASGRLTLTYGLRWDVDFAPSSNPSFAAVTDFNLSNLSSLALAPPGSQLFHTTYRDFAPRLGVAYQLARDSSWQTVLRGGFGIFYDLATTEVGNSIFYSAYPFGATSVAPSNKFPLSSAQAAGPPITSVGTFIASDPNLVPPYTLQWNVALEQALGAQQTISASYIGSVGRNLLQMAVVPAPSPSFTATTALITNAASSDYNALQVQFQRRLSHGLQTLASWTWSHSIDTASAGSLFGNTTNALQPASVNANRGPSDFDIRNAVSAGLTYAIPVPRANPISTAILRDWSIESIVQSRSAPPVTVYDGRFSLTALNNSRTLIRPDLVSGQPLYLYGSQYPGGKGFNPNAFVDPPTNSTGTIPLRQGDLGRNALRGFGATQWDLAVHRDFPIRESLKLQFRAEMFNVLNHPNFGSPVGNLSNKTQFGQATTVLSQSLSGDNTPGTGGFSALYQLGGPRSIQFALKLNF